jgi:Acyl-coenzyme A:6-aminopenicillanic acid acyl-transferase
VLRLVKAEGDTRARGRAIGRALGDLIDRSLAFYREYLGSRGLDRQELERTLTPYREAAEHHVPRLVAQLDAVAEAAEADPLELFAVNALEELEQLFAPGRAAVERCNSFTAVAPGSTILAHSEHWLAEDAGNVALVVELPDDGSPALASVTVAACLPAVGLNAFAAAQGIDSLAAVDDRAGVPRVLVSRHALEASGRSDAIRRAGLPGRAGGYAHVFAFAGGETLTIETTAERVAVVAGPGGHTNHYLDAELSELEREASEASRARHARLSELLRERPVRTPEDAMALLRDEGLAPTRAQYATVFAMVGELESGCMWVAAGDPRECAYEEVDLGRVV